VVTPGVAAELDKVVAYLETNDIAIRIEGHTDTDGGEEKNLILSQRRADAVKAYLVQAGIDEARIEAEGLGESAPKVSPEQTADDKAMNRRIEFVVAG
jgi:OOP family OmpA-OmpF porin